MNPNHSPRQPVAGRLGERPARLYRGAPEMERPPAHPTELACPCCLPALGEFGEMPPHGGLAGSLGDGPGAAQTRGEQSRSGLGDPRFHRGRRGPVPSPAEDSPSGLWRSLGKRVGLTPSGVRIPYPPPLRPDPTGQCPPPPIPPPIPPMPSAVCW